MHPDPAIPGPRRARRAALALALLLPAAAHAELYLYALPGGGRMFSDHALANPHYRLLRTAGSVRGLESRGGGIASVAPVGDTAAYDRLIRRAAASAGVDFCLVKAIVRVESGFDPYAVSDKGALGLMQLLPSVAQRYGVTDAYDPAQNIEAGVRHLRTLLRRFHNRPRLAIAAYNAGARAVAEYHGVPPFAETRRYVAEVVRYQRRYARGR